MIANFLKIGFAWDEVGVIATLTAKLAILILYFRVFSIETSMRYAIFGTMAFTCLLYVPNLFVYIGLCVPRPGESWHDFNVGMRCMKGFKWFLAHAAMVVVLDIIILILPLPCLAKLQLSNKKKTGIALIFLTAIL